MSFVVRCLLFVILRTKDEQLTTYLYIIPKKRLKHKGFGLKIKGIYSKEAGMGLPVDLAVSGISIARNIRENTMLAKCMDRDGQASISPTLSDGTNG